MIPSFPPPSPIDFRTKTRAYAGVRLSLLFECTLLTSLLTLLMLLLPVHAHVTQTATANRGERGIWTVGDYAIGDATIGKTTTDKSRFRSLQTQTYIVHDPGTWIHHPDSLAHYQSIGM
ncbi:hypothetical protein DFP72DRAFT_1050903 [Ephemerocybe angulata]|uniref:Uncharacterized protein n=1 Tax=Ephemerocybe angulata TaxID=980116 RepID=A0A8H6HFT8_9AGAR|nr:hypothetical protein DFP72DRAFT_1050903 [Tulosesus angulatus]